MAIVGIGLDVCAIERIRNILAGSHGARFLERVFTPSERELCGRRSDAAPAYAARYAAKEALVKALGAPKGMTWRDMEVVRAEGMPPSFVLTGVASRELAQRNASVFLSITHDAGVAAATVVLEAK